MVSEDTNMEESSDFNSEDESLLKSSSESGEDDSDVEPGNSSGDDDDDDDADDDDDDDEEEEEDDEADPDDMENQLGRFLDYAKDIPTALKDLTGMSMEVAHNMSMVGYMQGNKVRNISQRAQGTLRKTRAVAQREREGEEEEDDEEDEEDAGSQSDFSDSESEYEEDEWDDAQAEAMGLTPALNRRAEKRRMSNKLKKQLQGKLVRDRAGIPEEAKDKLGSGNIKYVEGHYLEAEELFMECIRLAPDFPDGYTSLSRLYEEMGDTMRSMNFLMAAAFFSKKDVQIWKDCARKSRENGAYRQAVYCYNNVIRREKDDPTWKRERGITIVNLGPANYKKALKDLREFHASFPEDAEVVETIVKVEDESGNIQEAIEVMDDFIRNYKDQVTLTHINMLAELYMKHPENKPWHKIPELVSMAREEYLQGQPLPIDLESKEAVAYVNMDRKDLAREMAKRFLANEAYTVTEYEDVYSLFADCFKQHEMYEDALPFAERLACYEWTMVKHWRGYAEVKGLLERSTDRLQGAIDAWKVIVEHVSKQHPNYVDAIVELSEKLIEHDNKDEALHYLERLNDPDVQPYAQADWTVDEDTYLKRSQVFESCGQNELYVRYFMNPIIKSLRLILVQAETTARSKRARGKSSDDGMSPHGQDLIIFETTQEKRGRKRGSDVDQFSIEEPFGFQMSDMADVPVFQNIVKERRNFDTILHLVKILLAMDDVTNAYNVCDLTVNVLAKKHPNKERRDQMKIQLAECCCRKRDWSNALKHIKGPADTPDGSMSPQVWNIFTKIAIGVGGVRQTSKYISNMRKKYPESLPIAVLSGHVRLQASDYAGALGEYLHAHRIDPKEPLVKLCISNLFANYACESKNCRDLALVHAFAWMQEYGRATGNAAEASYNAGRIAQQFSMHHLAVPLYRESLYYHDAKSAEAALEAEMADADLNGEDDAVGSTQTVAAFARQISEGFVVDKDAKDANGIAVKTAFPGKGNGDLAREAAFNLSLILIESNAHDLAREVRRRYLSW